MQGGSKARGEERWGQRELGEARREEQKVV